MKEALQLVTEMPQGRKHKYLMSGFLDAWAWFDDALRPLLNEPFTPSQSILFLRVGEGTTRPTDIARQMRLSKQAVKKIADDLIDRGYMTLVDDPTDGRQKMLLLTPKGAKIGLKAQQIIFNLEDLMGSRIGNADYEIFRRVLNADWGIAPKKRNELPQGGRRASNNPPLPVARNKKPTKSDVRPRWRKPRNV
jgi:DNA-binding MarR family transcriptional regulator